MIDLLQAENHAKSRPPAAENLEPAYAKASQGIDELIDLPGGTSQAGLRQGGRPSPCNIVIATVGGILGE